jgi:hypothetical protein
MADRRLGQKAEITLVPRRGPRVTRTPDKNITLLPDCERPLAKLTVMEFSGGQT